MAKIVGVSCGFHDAAMAAVSNGKILFAGHAERYSGIKNDKDLPFDLIFDAIQDTDPEIVAYYEKPVPKMLRMLYAGQKPVYNSARKALRPGMWGHSPQYVNYNHHLSHAAAGFQTSYFMSAIVVVVDAIGEWDTASIWHAHVEPHSGKARYKKLWSLKYPSSLGLFYSACTERVGLKPNEDEYILMGMAAYGKTNLFDKMDHQYFDGLTCKQNLHIGFDESMGNSMNCLDHYSLALSAQTVLENKLAIIFDKAEKFAAEYDVTDLVYMGGVALNCAANTRVISQDWSSVWIMPNPGDAGSALGAAALAYGYQLQWETPALGYDIPGEYPVTDVVDELEKNKLVGVAAGRAEYGPRAFGNRSLLADPRGPEIKDMMNEIKQRQKFRPFAPVVMAEFADDYFDMRWLKNKNTEYMQFTTHCKRPELFPAVVHHDNTSRIQTVPRDSALPIRKVLEEWYNRTGCPMLLNTSLNIKGKPIVNNESHALDFNMRYGVKVCLGGNKWFPTR